MEPLGWSNSLAQQRAGASSVSQCERPTIGAVSWRCSTAQRNIRCDSHARIGATRWPAVRLWLPCARTMFMPEAGRGDLSDKERDDVTELAAPRSPVIYEVVRRQGEEELRRPLGSLFWSGIAAGVTIMASVIAEGALHHKLPAEAAWREPVSEAGYSLGFLMVILGRMQLFTEQTIVAVLPVMAAPSWKSLGGTARLWGVVLFANLA